MISYHASLVNHFETAFAALKGAAAYETFGFYVNNLIVSAVTPKNLQDEQLPAMFYGYGTARVNQANAPGVNFRGETLGFLVNLVFARVNADQTDTTTPLLSLMNTAAKAHDAVLKVISGIQTHIENAPSIAIRDVRLASVTPFSQGLSDREFMQFTIEIDWYYPI